MEIRHPTRADLDRLAMIEARADTLYVERFGATDWEPPHSGHERAAAPGFVLVAAEGSGGDRGKDAASSTAHGFVHVLEIEGQAHLEQLAVLPEQHRRGIGSALVRAAMVETARRGFSELTLMTYRDVPWNEPFYARLGFVPVAPRSHLERELARIERGLELDRYGARTLMVACTTSQGVTSQ